MHGTSSFTSYTTAQHNIAMHCTANTVETISKYRIINRHGLVWNVILMFCCYSSCFSFALFVNMYRRLEYGLHSVLISSWNVTPYTNRESFYFHIQKQQQQQKQTCTVLYMRFFVPFPLFFFFGASFCLHFSSVYF